MHALIFAALLAVDSASASQPSIGEIVARAQAQFARKPKKLSCTVSITATQLDTNGKPTETQANELTETWTDGVPEQGLAYARSVDGKPLTPAEMVKANQDEKDKREEMKEHEKKGDGGNVDSPLAAAQVARHNFSLLRKDVSDGRAVYVLAVEPKSQEVNEKFVTREGTLVLDAETFLLAKSDTHAAPLPKHVTKMIFSEEFQLDAQGESAPKSLTLEVKGGILFFTRTYRLETKWRDCK
jgi:hypothetical protein